jgi:hypothetical protein
VFGWLLPDFNIYSYILATRSSSIYLNFILFFYLFYYSLLLYLYFFTMSGKFATKSYYYFVKSVKRDDDVDFTGCGTFFGGGRCFED